MHAGTLEERIEAILDLDDLDDSGRALVLAQRLVAELDRSRARSRSAHAPASSAATSRWRRPTSMPPLPSIRSASTRCGCAPC